MGYKVNEFVSESFTNEFGQVINPGDEVVYVGKSWQSTKIGKGKFAGVYKGKSWNHEVIVRSVRVDDIPGRYFFYDRKNGKGEWRDVKRKAILPLKRVFKIDQSLASLAGKVF